ncbi:MAG: prepilin-type N-terminal cleavage/methylation domain-containing protein [Candidatus Omnitrophica bacterium]|nr:prepilin-type N-terminal cleavage/methylation domain-containing protein [Candidatus Omnitrophota bacterium]
MNLKLMNLPAANHGVFWRRRIRRRVYKAEGAVNNTIRAFTLIEVMVAVAILSLGLVLVIQVFSTCLRAVESSSNLSKAAILAQSKLDEIEIMGLYEKPASRDEFEGGASGFNWKVESLRQEIETDKIWQRADENKAVPGLMSLSRLKEETLLYQVTVTIFWRERGKERDLKFVSYLAPRSSLRGETEGGN